MGHLLGVRLHPLAEFPPLFPHERDMLVHFIDYVLSSHVSPAFFGSVWPSAGKQVKKTLPKAKPFTRRPFGGLDR
jgi:hypothetical protein